MLWFLSDLCLCAAALVTPVDLTFPGRYEVVSDRGFHWGLPEGGCFCACSGTACVVHLGMWTVGYVAWFLANSILSCSRNYALLRRGCLRSLSRSRQSRRQGAVRCVLISSVSFTNDSHRIDHVITTLIISGFGKIVIIPMVIWEYNGLHFVANLFTLASNVEATIGCHLLVLLAMIPFLTYLLT